MVAGHENLTLDGWFEAGYSNLGSWAHTEQAPGLGETAGLSPQALRGTTGAQKHCRGETHPGSPARGVQAK